MPVSWHEGEKDVIAVYVCECACYVRVSEYRNEVKERVCCAFVVHV